MKSLALLIGAIDAADLGRVALGEADIDERQMVMLDFAVKCSRAAKTVGEDDFARLAKVGFSEEAAWDICAVAAFFAMSNRLANVMALRPNDEFYSMGRSPRAP